MQFVANSHINTRPSSAYPTTTKTSKMNELTDSFKKINLEDELKVPIVNLDIEEWFDLIMEEKPESVKPEGRTKSDKSNLADSISLCSSLEDLVKTFDKSVKECLVNYKDIDIGQLAPVQVRSQEEVMNDSQIWYTLTGNFGNLLPIDYWSSGDSLLRKYHNHSLNIKNPKKRTRKYKTRSDRRIHFDNCDDLDLEDEKHHQLQHHQLSDSEENTSEYSFKTNSDEWSFEQSCKSTECDSFRADEEEYYDEDDDNIDDQLENQIEDDDDELRDQLDMHSMIIAKSIYNDESECMLTAEQVLSEIESIMTLQENEEDECCVDEMTPDSGCYSIASHLNQDSFYSILNSTPSNEAFTMGLDGSYLNYINTFATHQIMCPPPLLPPPPPPDEMIQNDVNNNQYVVSGDLTKSSILSHQDDTSSSLTILIPNKKILNTLNLYELNDLIDQIEASTKELSDILVHELDVKDELEFEKETKNTFISLLMSIHEKRRLLLSNEYANCASHASSSRHLISNISINFNSSSSSSKKKNRRSITNLDYNNTTHLTTIIPYNSEIKYNVQHLQLLNKLLKAINEQSQQVPELLTNYILKVVCPT